MTTQLDPDLQASDTAQNDWSRRRRLIWLGLILALYLIVTLLYGLVNPLFEAPDEHWHYFTAQYIAENGRLPFVASGDVYDEWLSQEAAQPPLYYLLGAVMIAPVDTSDAREEVWPNKFASVGNAGALININRFVHTEIEDWPWKSYAQAAHILRWFSTLLGAGTLIFIYLAGRLMWPRDTYRALLAAGLVAFLPQYNFLHASVSNDSLIIFLISAALWQLIRIWQTGVSRKRLLLLGITIGLAALAKNAGVILLLYALGVLLLLAIRNQAAFDAGSDTGESELMSGWQLVGASVLLVALPVMLIAGWLWVRNLTFYGDPLATNQFVQIAGGDRNYTVFQVLQETPGLWFSTIAIFGWFNLRAPDWVYWFWSGLACLAVAGAVWRAVKSYSNRSPGPFEEKEDSGLWSRAGDILQEEWFLPLLLALWVVVVYASLVLFMLQTEAAQGRLLFPALLPVALGMASGLTATRTLRQVSVVFPFFAFLITLYCLYYVVQPAYKVPPTVAELPPETQILEVDMGNGLRLEGALIEPEHVLPGDSLWMTLYWQFKGGPAAGDLAKEAPEFVLSVFGRDQKEIGKVHSYHGRGLYPAGLWPEGEIIADRIGLRIDEEAEVPVLAVIDGTILDGTTTRIGEIKIEPASWPPPVGEKLAQVGQSIEMLDVRVLPQSARPGDTLSIDVLWQARSDIEEDLTTLLHLGQPDAAPLATGDRPPLDGRYPTRVWENGEQIDDHYELRLPDDLEAGRYPLWIGMYNPQTMLRLPILIEDETQPFDVYLAGWIDVE
jgi:4-amino-4-deoxy-L-arabinose transferase-like glycosyltransferase